MKKPREINVVQSPAPHGASEPLGRNIVEIADEISRASHVSMGNAPSTTPATLKSEFEALGFMMDDYIRVRKNVYFYFEREKTGITPKLSMTIFKAHPEWPYWQVRISAKLPDERKLTMICRTDVERPVSVENMLPRIRALLVEAEKKFASRGVRRQSSIPAGTVLDYGTDGSFTLQDSMPIEFSVDNSVTVVIVQPADGKCPSTQGRGNIQRNQYGTLSEGTFDNSPNNPAIACFLHNLLKKHPEYFTQ